MKKIEFVNGFTGETLSHKDFVTFIWDEAQRQFEDNNTDENWADLTMSEQIEIYCDQYEYQLECMNWAQV